MKKIAALLLGVLMIFSLVACGASKEDETALKPNGPEEGAVEVADDVVYKIGIVQLVQHEALDRATQGFMDGLSKELGTKHLEFNVQNAQGDSATCATIVNSFVADKVDLILANATPALQAAATGTEGTDIPVLGTSITDYGAALEIKDFNGTVGGNISGTSDLAPLDKQAEMVLQLCPDAKTVGILYCSAEANSVFQADQVEAYLKEKGITVQRYTFADSNDVATVTASACSECDALYVPTDNTAASCGEVIHNTASGSGVPIVVGEVSECKIFGIATLSIDYYKIGEQAGKMAAQILTGEADISEMEIAYDPDPVKMYNPEICEELGIEVPDDYQAVELD